MSVVFPRTASLPHAASRPQKSPEAVHRQNLVRGAHRPDGVGLAQLPPELVIAVFAQLPLPTPQIRGLGPIGALRQAWPQRAACGFVAHPQLRDQLVARLARAYLRGPQGAPAAALLHHLPACRTLQLNGLGLGDDPQTARRLATLLDHAPQLRVLNLEFNDLGPTVARALPLHRLPNLRALHLNWNRLGPQGAAGLALGSVARLEVLELAGNALGTLGAEALGLGTHAAVTSLDLRENDLGHLGIQALQLHRFPRLTELRLGCNHAGPRGAAVLAACNLGGLEILDLGGNRLGPRGLYALRLANMPQLRELYLPQNRLGELGQPLPSFAPLVALEVLEISENNLHLADLAGLELYRCKGLTEFYAQKNGLGPRGLEQLHINLFCGVEWLDLSDNALAQDPLLHVRLAKMFRLAVLDLSGNALTEANLAPFDPEQLEKVERFDLSRNAIACTLDLAVKVRHLPKLRSLRLEGNRLRRRCMGILVRAVGPRLRELVMEDNLEEPDYDALQRVAPRLKLY